MEQSTKPVPNVIVSPVAKEHAHDRHTGRRLRIALIAIAAIVVIIVAILLVRSYKNKREEKFQNWYDQQRLSEMSEMMDQVRAGGVPAPTDAQIQLMLKSASKEPTGITFEEARALGQQYAADREAEARSIYKNSN